MTVDRFNNCVFSTREFNRKEACMSLVNHIVKHSQNLKKENVHRIVVI